MPKLPRRELLTIQQAMQRMGVSRNTVYNYVRTGRVETERTVTGMLRIYADSLFKSRPSRPQPLPPSISYFEDIQCKLNPVQRADLETILRMTPEPIRVPLAMLWAGLTLQLWTNLAGFTDHDSQATLSRWLNLKHRLPLGAALRLSAVLGIPCDVLFAQQVYGERVRDTVPARRLKKAV